MLKVLLVDDEPFIVQGMQALIDWESEGFEVVGTAANGREAIEFLKNCPVDLIIADIRMPMMTGFELLEQLRREKLSKAYFVILSGYSDFQYAQQAIRYHCMDYILKPVQEEELIKVLHKVVSTNESRMEKQKEEQRMEKAYLSRNLIALLSGKYDEINLKNVRERIEIQGEVRYIDLEVDERRMQGKISDEEKRALQRKLYESCMRYLGPKESCRCIFDVSREEKSFDIGFLYSRSLSKERNLREREYLDEFLRAVTAELKAPVVMYVGSMVNRIQELSESYRTAAIARSFQNFQVERNINYYEQEAQKRDSGMVLCKSSLDELICAVEKNDREEICAATEELYAQINRLGMDAELMNLNINYLLFQLIHLATKQDDKVNQEEILRLISGSAFEQGTMRGSKEHMKRFACEYAEYLVQLRRKVSLGGVLGEIEREVREHYGENLTLKSLSEKYFVNSAYLGQIFRKKYGQPFKEYLNGYRIEQAVLLLEQTDRKIYEIAEEVGYRDLDYFINRFIAARGCTPAKYRKQYREGEQ